MLLEHIECSRMALELTDAASVCGENNLHVTLDFFLSVWVRKDYGDITILKQIQLLDHHCSLHPLCSPKQWLGECLKITITVRLKLTNQHPKPLQWHFCFISNSLHQIWEISFTSAVPPRLPLSALPVRTRDTQKKSPLENPVPPSWLVSSCVHSQTWSNSLASPSKHILCVSGDLGFHVHFAPGSLSLQLTGAQWLVFSAFLDCQFVPSCKVILLL